MAIGELDVVRVVKLLTPTRHVDTGGWSAAPPSVGDEGTIVHVHPGGQAFIVDCVNFEARTGWLADFVAEELELVHPHDGGGR